MELVVIYGAPGVGKLSVARQVAARTGYRLFHNHLSLDLVLSLFDFGTEPQERLTAKLRLMMLEEAAKANLSGVIYTLVYALGDDDAFVQEVIDAIEPHGGRVRFVLLTCEVDTLLDRVVNESRAAFDKLRSREKVVEMLAQYRMTEPVPHRPSLVIDNTHLSPGDVADRIVAYLQAQR